MSTALAPLVVPIAATPVAASPPPMAGTLAQVPAAFRDQVAAGARACTDIPPPVLAAQLEVASGFDALAELADGARGLAGLTPTTWAVWGLDADGDGLSSPLDSFDAVDAQSRRMCWLYRMAVDSDLPGDRVRLALAGYDVGWPKVVAAGGIPAEARAYVDRVSAVSWSFGRRPVTAFGSGIGIPLGLPLPVANPRGPAEAATWARAQTAGAAKWLQLCLNFMAQSYGWSYSGTPYAIDHYWEVPARLRHPLDRNPPRGALLFWDTGRRAGHVALALGDGMIASNDIVTPGRISVVPASRIEERWGARYIGWTAPYFPGGG